MLKYLIMKNLIFIFCSFALLFTSCQKEEDNSPQNQEKPAQEDLTMKIHIYPATAQVVTNALSDIDGNVYDAVQMGEQLWMAENLRSTRYADGTEIPMGDSTFFGVPYRYLPNGAESNVSTCGYLYNYAAAIGTNANAGGTAGVQGVCPDGWHVPSDAEWTQLTDYVSSQSDFVMGNDAQNIAKAMASTTGWKPSGNAYAVGNDASLNNATGFSTLAAGGFYNNVYTYFNYTANFWTSTEVNATSAWIRSLYYGNAKVLRFGYSGNKSGAYSVRCLQD